MYFSSFTKQNSNNQKKVQRSGGFKIKLNPISRQLIRMTWGSRFQLEMVKGSLVFVIGKSPDFFAFFLRNLPLQITVDCRI